MTVKKSSTKKVKAVLPELIRDVKLLTKQIEDHIAAGTTWQAKTQQLLISAAFLPLSLNKKGEMTGQITPLIRLAEGTATLTHKNAVAKWIEAYAPVTIKNGEVKFSAAKAKKMMEGGEHEAIDKLINSVPYFKMIAADKPFDGFDLRAKLAGLLKQAKKFEKALDEGEVEVKGDTIELNENLRKKIVISKDDIDVLEGLLKNKAKDIGAPAVLLN